LSGLIAVTEAHFKRPTIEQLSLIAVTKEPSKLVALGNWCLGACLHASVSPRFCELIRWSRAEKPPSLFSLWIRNTSGGEYARKKQQTSRLLLSDFTTTFIFVCCFSQLFLAVAFEQNSKLLYYIQHFLHSNVSMSNLLTAK
jgi:hypothetical protein